MKFINNKLNYIDNYDYELEKIIDKILVNPRSFYTEICYSLSVEEREYLKSVIDNKTCNNCSNGSCRVESIEKFYDNKSCIGWENPVLAGKQRLLSKKYKIK